MAQVGILSTIHFAHTALADFLNDFVVADGGADHVVTLWLCETRNYGKEP